MNRRLFFILLILLLTSLWLTPVLAQDPFPPLSEAITPPEPNGPFALSEDVITYQGLLQVSGVEAVGIYDFQFRVFSTLSGGVQVGSTLPVDNVNIATGIFSVQLNFGESVFTGEERWLEIAVKADASGSYTILAPRQQVTPAPMALALPGLWTSRNPFSPNLMGGYEGNSTNPNAIGQTIGGGGASGILNATYDNYSTVNGGAGNHAGSNDADVTNGVHATVGGGLQNNVTAPYATVGGGLSNTTTGIAAVIAGGSNNAATGGSAFVGGGNGNQANGNYSVVGGGLINSANNDVAFIGGGYNNTVLALFGTIGGGGGLTSEEGNVIYDDYGTIAGGSDNQTGLAGDATTNQYYATVSGGRSNSALNRYAVIGGGYNNIVYGEFGTIGGGGSETSGDGNIIYDNYGTISGGYNNTAGVLGPTNEVFATVGGGERNRASASYTVIGAGYRNSATGNFSAVLGGSENSASGTFSTVGGGASNEATGFAATLAGGNSNGAMNVNTFVGGGLSNYANGIATVIGGGQNNTANGNYSAILGGQNNTTFGEYSLAGGGGAIAQHDGAFVWAGTQEKEGDTISSSAPNQFVVRAPGGVWFGSGNTVTMPEGAFLATDSGAYLTRGGSWANASDRALKTGFALVNGQQVLEQLAQLPIQSWNYISEGSDTRHIGPTAQDFYTAFGLGTDDKHIATVDADGIALVAIQGLHEQNRTQSDQIAALEARLAALEQGQLSTAFSPTFVIAIIAGLAAGWLLRGSLQGQKGASA